jgi:anti-anti-sigma regulatory factor
MLATIPSSASLGQVAGFLRTWFSKDRLSILKSRRLRSVASHRGELAGVVRSGRSASHLDRTSIVTIRDWPDLLESESLNRLLEVCDAHLRAGPVHLELDLRHADDADTKVVATLVALRKRVELLGCSLRIHSSAHLTRLFEVCRLQCMLTARSIPGESHVSKSSTHGRARASIVGARAAECM